MPLAPSCSPPLMPFAGWLTEWKVRRSELPTIDVLERLERMLERTA